MDIIFGSISKEQRDADINKQERGMFSRFQAALDVRLKCRLFSTVLEHGEKHVDSEHGDSIDRKV
jgi:hypothetical protein